MALLLTTQNLSKTFGPEPLFRNISLNIFEGSRLGLIGPNGSGKSTLLQILAGKMEADSGTPSYRKNTRVGYIAQQSDYDAETIRAVIENALRSNHVPESEWAGRIGETLGRAGFTAFEVAADTLSGGWRKRLAIAEALVSAPDVLLLDEPTNHLDLEGIEWLEQLLKSAPFASVVISHDRYFLENVATTMAELNRIYPDGLLQVRGTYSVFLEKKDEFLTAQSKQVDALQNRVRTEIEWLRRGPKARATKAKARIQKANELIGDLKDLQSRSRTGSTDIDFTASERKTKKLIECESVDFSYADRPICRNFDLTITAGMRLGLVGPNGSGKTTLLRLLRGEVSPQSGVIRRAEALRIVYFDQNRPLDTSQSLRRALAPDSDSVIFRERTIHVASWAARFLFSNEQLNQPVSRLSGGERARVLIARLMLEAADVLLLDEPTNDLDIPTLEILEESLLEFPGALILVTHDRYLLDRVSTTVLGLDGRGQMERFADYSQWELWRDEQARPLLKESRAAASPPNASARKKLSYLDSRDMETIEARITEAERQLAEKRAALDDSAVVTSPERLQSALQEIAAAQGAVDVLYARWSELEAKLA